jgi:AraC-like DNA-binding protein
MDMDYPSLAKVFSARNKLSLKQYIISERIKKVKELILNHQDNLSDISSKLHYSSTAHLCNEFKRVTGFTPKIYRNNL